MDKQNTIKDPVSVSGIALHTGARAGLKILPADENTGITFRRVDLPGKPEVKALAQNVVDVRRGTTIASGNASVVTVEHVMAALHAAQIDNAIVEMDGFEPPILDGSALPYCAMVKEAGKVEQNAPARYIVPKEPAYVEYKGTKTIILPCDKFIIDCVTSFGDSPLDTQYREQEITEQSFSEEIAPARTFVSYRDLAQLLAMGLVKGGSLDNAIIIHDGAMICKEELRFENELARHKILDIVGDMYLTGCRVKGHIIAIKPGHPTNVQLAGAVLKQYM